MRFQRELEMLEETLEASEPRLAAMYTMFNELTEGEAPARTEPVPVPFWRAWLVPIAGFAVLAAVVASGLVLSTSAPSSGRSCTELSAVAPGARTSVLAGQGAGTGCPAYRGTRSVRRRS
jgi:hypothetical protein